MAQHTWTLCESLPVSGIGSLRSGPCLYDFSMSALVRRGPEMPSPHESYPIKCNCMEKQHKKHHFHMVTLYTYFLHCNWEKSLPHIWRWWVQYDLWSLRSGLLSGNKPRALGQLSPLKCCYPWPSAGCLRFCYPASRWRTPPAGLERENIYNVTSPQLKVKFHHLIFLHC